MKNAADLRLRTKPLSFIVGDFVLLKQNCTHKSMSHFEPLVFRIINVKGKMITVSAGTRVVTRNVSFFKKWEGNRPKEPVKKTSPSVTSERPVARRSCFSEGTVGAGPT